MSDFTVKEVLPGINIALGGICNRGIIESQGSVLVIDSGISAGEATPLRAAAQKYQTEAGTISLFNTHPHGDHVFGNQVFAADTIIGQQALKDTMIETGEQSVAGFKQRPGMAELLGDITITPPSVTFQDTYALTVGTIEVQLHHFGVAHSPSDSVAWLPQSRVLFTGDLLFNNLVPALPPGGNVANWINALEKLEQFDAQHVIPGHGPVQSPEALVSLRSWLVELYARVTAAVNAGWEQEKSVEKISDEMKALAPRASQERLPGIIQVAYGEISSK
jgi:cyclase